MKRILIGISLIPIGLIVFAKTFQFWYSFPFFLVALILLFQSILKHKKNKS